MNQVPHSDSPRSEFGAYLRSQRQQRELSLSDIARVTKIPKRSLAHLEDGDFEALPAEVFVRGFLRSYARCVGMDPEDTVARYRDVGRPAVAELAEASDLESAGADGESLATLADEASASGESKGTAARPRDRASRDDDDASCETAGAESGPAVESGLDNGRSWPHATGAFIARSLFERDVDEDASRRGTVTLAVIILVILATLTTSYWLRRPSSSGSGVTDAGELVLPPAADRLA